MRITKKSLHENFRDITDRQAERVLERAQRIRETGNQREVDRHMDKINALIDGFGVEAVFYAEGIGIRPHMSDMGDELLALYVNTGDSYSPTILWDARKDTVTLTTWGDFVEHLPRKYSDNPVDPDDEDPVRRVFGEFSGKTKTVRVLLTADTLLEWSTSVDVPANATKEQLKRLGALYDEQVEGGEYEENVDFFERRAPSVEVIG
jgi:hypothetical protein